MELFCVSHLEFKKFCKARGSDFGNAPTPAVSTLGREKGKLAIQMIAVDESFLPEGAKEEYLNCLMAHELSEADFYVQNPDKLAAAVERSKKGEPASPDAHLYALREELKFAAQLGVLEEYCRHWQNWLSEKLEKINDPEIKKAVEERVKWRAEALVEVRKESEQPEHFKKVMR